ncbi:hypothetical protein [Mycobacterium sp. ZZG]
MNIVLDASWCFALAGIVLGSAALIVFRRPLPALRVTLELLTAAGLLRLSVDSSWTAITVAAGLIVLRRVITRTLIADLTPSPRRTPRTT